MACLERAVQETAIRQLKVILAYLKEPGSALEHPKPVLATINGFYYLFVHEDYSKAYDINPYKWI